MSALSLNRCNGAETDDAGRETVVYFAASFFLGGSSHNRWSRVLPPPTGGNYILVEILRRFDWFWSATTIHEKILVGLVEELFKSFIFLVLAIPQK